MKTRETIDAIGFVTLTTLLTAGVAVAGVLQAAAAGIDLLVAAPFAQAKARPVPVRRATRESYERRFARAA